MDSNARQSLITRLIRPEIRALSAYHVQPATGMVKLDAMENPYPWPGALTAAWQQALASAEVNRYPDPQATGIRQALSQQMRVPEGCDLLFGNGSDELIQIIALALSPSGGGVLAPRPSFVMYDMISRFAGVPFHSVALDDSFDLDLDAMLEAIARHQPDVIYLAQPNNPTGNRFSEQKVKAVLDAAPGLVVIDEAYMAFTDQDAVPWLAQYGNLLVMRTLSKMGLAGLRFGLLIGHADWIRELDKLRLPYNINNLTQISVAFALDHYDELLVQTDRIRASRSQLAQALTQFEALQVFPSEANFILARCQGVSARAVFERLKEQGVLVKCLDGGDPLMAGCLRFTVGAEAENTRLLQALEVAFSELALSST